VSVRVLHDGISVGRQEQLDRELEERPQLGLVVLARRIEPRIGDLGRVRETVAEDQRSMIRKPQEPLFREVERRPCLDSVRQRIAGVMYRHAEFRAAPLVPLGGEDNFERSSREHRRDRRDRIEEEDPTVAVEGVRANLLIPELARCPVRVTAGPRPQTGVQLVHGCRAYNDASTLAS
jgi:hypothetical protein